MVSNHPDADIVSLDTRRIPNVSEVCNGVFIADGLPTPALLEHGQYLTGDEFSRAGVIAGKSENYGLGFFTAIALGAALEHEFSQPVPNDSDDWPYPNELYNQISSLMRHPDELKKGSRERVLLGSQYVFDLYYRPDSCAIGPHSATGRLGRKILHIALFDSFPLESR